MRPFLAQLRGELDMSTPILDPHSAALPDPPPVTPEDLLTMPDGHRFELVNGKLVERNMGAESSQVATTLISLIHQHVRANRLGKVFAQDCGYQCYSDDPKKVRFPDGSFLARGRLPDERTPLGHIRISPDLAVEVISPNDTAEEVETKRREYLRAGVRLVWIVYPENRTVHVSRQAGPPAELDFDAQLTGEDVLPGFTCRVAELFEDV
jgi:Uma2 family endonuclease